MSFFDLNSKVPEDSIDFQDTYEGLGEDNEDQFNNETFGSEIPAGEHFSFGNQAPVSKVDPSVSYAQAVSTVSPVYIVTESDSLKPLDSLWDNPQTQTPPSKKVLSLEELEANLSHNRSPFQQQQQQQPMMPYGSPYNGGYGMPIAPPFGVPPQNWNYPNQGFGGFNQGYPGQQQFSLIPQGHQQIPQQPPQGPQQPQQVQKQEQEQQGYEHQQEVQPAQHQNYQTQQQVEKPQQLAQQPLQQVQQPQTPQQAVQQVPQDSPHQFPPGIQGRTHLPRQKSKQLDLNQFPILGAAVGPSPKAADRRQVDTNIDVSPEPVILTPEEEERLLIKNKKLERIMRFSQLMTPRDKDFVTRFQISQIVTEDPYNEDFYYQIFKAIKNGGEDESLNSIAQYYLEHSGHRLGGKHKRADVALQRMQQQVTKAVTVAKERPKNQQFSKEGSLGKISFASGKTPRKQLEILKKEIEANAEDNSVLNKYSQDTQDIKLSNKVILSCIEKTYAKILELESKEKNHEPVIVDELWESLYIEDQKPNVTGKIDEVKESIFVSFLNFNKGLKLFPRVFRYLNNEQKFKLTENFVKKFSLLKLLDDSNYDSYFAKDLTVRIQIDKRSEAFSNLCSKFIISYISNDVKFDDIIKLIIHLINYNPVSKLLHNKIGLSLTTILISKIELIKQDVAITSSDLLIWSNVYDNLFNKLINNLISAFPKELYVGNELGQFDDSYIWHFLASLALAGKLQHQRIIVDEVRDKVFGCVEFAKKLTDKDESIKKLTNLNLFLNVMGLNANASGDITELK